LERLNRMPHRNHGIASIIRSCGSTQIMRAMI
jgi:hypothetical protein